MLIRLEKGSGMPVTRQILEQFRAQCASGVLRPGDKLPSVRELARQLTVNQNTVLRVYERLEADGLIERRHGSGSYVTEAADDAMRRQGEQLRSEARALVDHARALGWSADQLEETIRELYKER